MRPKKLIFFRILSQCGQSPRFGLATPALIPQLEIEGGNPLKISGKSGTSGKDRRK
jgi:hypothetical protein